MCWEKMPETVDCKNAGIRPAIFHFGRSIAGVTGARVPQDRAATRNGRMPI